MNVPHKLDGSRKGDARESRLDNRLDPRGEFRADRMDARFERPIRAKSESEEENEGLDLKGLMRFFLRRRWVMLGIAGILAIFIFGLIMMQPPKFTAAALLMISPQKNDLVTNQGASAPDAALDAGAIESQIEILQSRKLGARLVDRLKLEADPEYNPALNPSPIARLLGAKPATKTAKLTKHQREEIVDRLGESVKAQRRGLTYVIEVSATTHDPKLSAKMANELVALYFDSQVQMKLDASRAANSWLSERLGLLKNEVQQKEAAVEAYRSSSGLLTASGNSLTEQQITGLQAMVIQARTDLAEREARYSQVRSLIRSGGSADSIGGVINSETIRTLRAQESEAARRQTELELRYGELHPSIAKARAEREGIQQNIRAEIARISENLKNEVDVAHARLNTLLGNQASVQGELVNNNSGMVKLRELERDAGATRAIYESFLKRYQELTESESLKVTDASLVGEATPPTGKSSPKKSIALILSLAVGLVVGVAVALCIDLVDEGLDDAAAVETATKKTVLASIPIVYPKDSRTMQSVAGLGRELTKASSIADLTRVLGQAVSSSPLAKFLPKSKRQKEDEAAVAEGGAGAAEWSPAAYLVEKPMSAFAEGLRSLRTSLLYTGLEHRVRVVAVTSALPGEGKTTTSVCLTRVSALAGQRVIVVECDLRRRSLNDVLRLKPKVGMLQVLEGKAKWADCLIVDAQTGVHVLPAADESFTPWDVFGSQAMRDLVAELSEHYDLVVLDCPPVLAVAETRIICRLADETILVVRWAHTPARAANGAIELIEQCGGNVVGIAINCVDPNAPGRGSFGDVTYQARYAGNYYHS